MSSSANGSNDADHSSIVTHVSSSSHIQPEDLGIGLLFWTMRDAVVVGDVTTGEIVLWNPAAQRLFGWSAAEAVGSPLERLIPHRLRAAHRAGFARYAATGHGPLVDRDPPVEVPAVCKDGTEITVELSLAPLAHGHPANGAAPYIAAFVRDATERTRLTNERAAVLAAAQDYARRLEELATLKADFSAIVAHELGAPVAAIRALADLAARGALMPEQQPTVFKTIRAEAHLLQRLVNDVQTASAIERDDFAIRMRPVPVAVLLADAAAFARTLIDEHPVRDDCEVEAMAMQVEANPERIGQVLRNLLGNAAKHTPPGTTIELRASAVEGHVHIDVADKGPGISAEDADRIFDKFGRGRDAEDSHTPGSGLGLYLARQILQTHGSDLRVSSQPGQGTVFTFDLQVVR